ncbi:MAG: S41 family peptidase [Paludibacter sp.]|nr:S41 family peptidase [Paludibacter sp.]
MKKHIVYIYFIFLAIATGLNSCIEDPDVEVNTNQGNFETLWKIIDTRYCYLDYKNINWDSIHTIYSDKFDSDTEELDFFNIMSDMLAELKDGHVNLYSDFDISRYWKWFTDSLSNFNHDIVYSDQYLGDDYHIAGGMNYDKIDNNKIGYVYYDDFSNTFTTSNMIYIFNYFKDCDGLIIDVRENGGGYIDQAEELASYFFTEETLTGYIQHKIGDGHCDFSNPVEIKTPANKYAQWKKPVAVIANRKSYSATNSFISRMKIAPNATIVGDKSGGGGGLPFSSEIPNGWLVRFSACPMYDANMQHIEWGIDPDIKVDLDSTDVANGYDTLIETAIAEIEKMK